MNIDGLLGNLEWSHFKSLVQTGNLSIKYVEFTDKYILKASDGAFSFACLVLKTDPSNTEQTDFEDNFKALGNIESRTQVSSMFEDENIVLKTARFYVTADANGAATISIVVPGAFGGVTRYVAGGDLYTDNYAFTDCCTKIEIIDHVGYTGTPGAVLQTYYDTEMDAGNQGWYFSKFRGSEGYLDFEPLGYYGKLYGDVTLKVTLSLQANANVKANLWWGVHE